MARKTQNRPRSILTALLIGIFIIFTCAFGTVISANASNVNFASGDREHKGLITSFYERDGGYYIRFVEFNTARTQSLNDYYTTAIYDRLGYEQNFSELRVGDLVRIEIINCTLTNSYSTYIHLADDSWSWEHRFINGARHDAKSIFIGNRQYILMPDIIVFDYYNESITCISDVDTDTLIIIRGIGRYAWYIEIHYEYGYVQFENLHDVVNGRIRVAGYAAYLTAHNQFQVHSGTHYIYIGGDNIVDELRRITVITGYSLMVSLDDIARNAGYLYLNIYDELAIGETVYHVAVYINNEQIEVEHIYGMQYRSHNLIQFGIINLRVEAEGFEPHEHKGIGFTQYLQEQIVALNRISLQSQTNDAYNESYAENEYNIKFVLILITIFILLLFLVPRAKKPMHKRKPVPFDGTSSQTDIHNEEITSDVRVGVNSAQSHMTSIGQQPITEVVINSKHLQSKYIKGKVNFNIYRGQMICVVGSSGAGKTALLKILAGYDRKFGGQLTICGGTWEKHETNLMPIVGFVPQDAILYKNIKPLTLLRYYSKVLDIKTEEGKIEEILDSLGDIATKEERPWYDQNIVKLSGGEQKRVSIAIELLRNPEILILDEPDSGLDSYHRQKLYSLLEKICEEKKMTIIFSSHINTDDNCNREDVPIFDKNTIQKHYAEPNCKIVKMYSYRTLSPSITNADKFADEPNVVSTKRGVQQ